MPDVAARPDVQPAQAAPRRIRVCHVITGLNAGGAEVMLQRLISATDRGRFDPVVVSLLPEGVVADDIRALNVPVYTLGLRGVRGVPGGVVRLARLLRRLRTDVVQGWMSHGNLMAGAAGRLAGGLPVAWGVHQVDIGGGTNTRLTGFAIRLGGLLSRRLARQIVYCAESALRAHAAVGYDPARAVVIPNGFDTQGFRPDPVARQAVREELGIAPDAPVVGLVARWHPVKDHGTFIAAAGRLGARLPDVRFVLAGRGVDGGNAELLRSLEAAGITDRCRLLGDRRDVARIMAALGVSTLSSRMEAFPVVVGEAMACGVPCVVTNVGDASVLVGDTGRIVPPGDPAALAQALDDLLRMDAGERRRLGRAAQQRVVERFSLQATAARYQDLHEAMAAGRPARGRPAAVLPTAPEAA
jgi:glycosyltransferase involved in cell wall biosynthesis